MSDISIMKTVREQHWRGPVVILALVALPWSIQVFDARDATFLFAWGLVNTNPPIITPLLDFLFIYTQGLPEYILAWPLSVLAYIGTLGSAVSGVVFDPVLDVFRVVSISRVVRSDWHDACVQQVVVPVERVVGTVSKHPNRLPDGERVTRDAHRCFLWCLLTLSELGCNWYLLPGGDNCAAVAVVVLVIGWIIAL